MKVYPAIFLLEDDESYTVYFPDIPGAITWGADFEQAYEYAQEVLGFALRDETTGEFAKVKPSDPAKVTHAPNEFVVAVPFDEIEYLKKYSTKSVRKNLTIPEWLNTLAVEKNINFSQVLQEALKNRLEV